MSRSNFHIVQISSLFSQSREKKIINRFSNHRIYKSNEAIHTAHHLSTLTLKAHCVLIVHKKKIWIEKVESFRESLWYKTIYISIVVVEEVYMLSRSWRAFALSILVVVSPPSLFIWHYILAPFHWHEWISGMRVYGWSVETCMKRYLCLSLLDDNFMTIEYINARIYLEFDFHAFDTRVYRCFDGSVERRCYVMIYPPFLSLLSSTHWIYFRRNYRSWRGFGALSEFSV